MSVVQAVRSTPALLSKRDNHLLGVSVGIHVSTSPLDLVNVLPMGLVRALPLTTFQS